LTSAQIAAATAFAVGTGQVAGTVSDNTVFQVGARYVIGPWKLFAGYEHVNFTNPSNPLAAGAFLEGGYILTNPNNANFPNDRILQTAWIGVKYSITPNLDIAGAYYHEWQNSFAVGANAGCSSVVSSQCSGTLDAVSLVVDWRFARHMDMYAGAMWSQVQNGLANGFLQTTATPGNTSNKANSVDPGIGLRYQF